MAVVDPRSNLQVISLTTYNPNAGVSTGSRVLLASPIRGQLLEAGLVPASTNNSALTLAVAINDFNASVLASTFVQCITSTLGTFASQATFEGAICSVVPNTATFINPGGVIQFTTSGGSQTSSAAAIGATLYAIIRRD